MKVETLKKIVELAEFRSEKIYDPTGEEVFRVIKKIGVWCLFDIIGTWDYYPLLLRRAVEGWNIKYFDLTNPTESVRINLTRITWIEDDAVKSEYMYSDYTKTEYLTPQEQAIEACLIELLDK